MDPMARKEALKSHLEEYKSKLIRILDRIDLNDLERIVTRLIRAYEENKTIYFVGNGGSAATSSHFQADFGFYVRYFVKKRMKVRSLSDHVPLLTAIGNDNAYEDVFVEQMRDNFEKGDVLLAISASGNSMNVVKAAEFANQQGGTSIGLVGFEGGRLKEVAHVCLHTPNPPGEYGPIEDLHLIVDHIIVTYFAKDKEFLSIGGS